MNLAQVLQLLQAINTLEPIAAQAVLQFIQRLEGKSTEDILTESDDIWQQVLTEAQSQKQTKKGK